MISSSFRCSAAESRFCVFCKNEHHQERYDADRDVRVLHPHREEADGHEDRRAHERPMRAHPFGEPIREGGEDLGYPSAHAHQLSMDSGSALCLEA